MTTTDMIDMIVNMPAWAALLIAVATSVLLVGMTTASAQRDAKRRREGCR